MNKAITFTRRVSTKSTIKILMIFTINNAASLSLLVAYLNEYFMTAYLSDVWWLM